LRPTDRPAGLIIQDRSRPCLYATDRPGGVSVQWTRTALGSAGAAAAAEEAKRLTEEVSEFGDVSRIHKSALSRCNVFCLELTERKREREREN
jgi:hypothetical protein